MKCAGAWSLGPVFNALRKNVMPFRYEVYSDVLTRWPPNIDVLLTRCLPNYYLGPHGA